MRSRWLEQYQTALGCPEMYNDQKATALRICAGCPSVRTLVAAAKAIAALEGRPCPDKSTKMHKAFMQWPRHLLLPKRHTSTPTLWLQSDLASQRQECRRVLQAGSDCSCPFWISVPRGVSIHWLHGLCDAESRINSLCLLDCTTSTYYWY